MKSMECGDVRFNRIEKMSWIRKNIATRINNDQVDCEGVDWGWMVKCPAATTTTVIYRTILSIRGNRKVIDPREIESSPQLQLGGEAVVGSGEMRLGSQRRDRRGVVEGVLRSEVSSVGLREPVRFGRG